MQSAPGVCLSNTRARCPSSPPSSGQSFPFLTLSSPAAAPPAPVCPLPLSFNLQMLSQAARLRSRQGDPSQQACARACAQACTRGGQITRKQKGSQSLPTLLFPHLKKVQFKQKRLTGPLPSTKRPFLNTRHSPQTDRLSLFVHVH